MIALKSKALCHIDRPMVAKGLCSACYQQFVKGKDFQSIVSKWAEIKSERIKTNSEKNVKNANERRKGSRKSLKFRYGLSLEDYERMRIE